MSTIAATNSLFEIDVELDSLLDEIEEQTAQDGEPSGELVARFQQFCSAHGEKVDRIGRFLRQMEAREQFCRSEAARLSDRARTARREDTGRDPRAYQEDLRNRDRPKPWIRCSTNAPARAHCSTRPPKAASDYSRSGPPRKMYGRLPRRSHSRQPRKQKGPGSQAPFALAAFFLPRWHMTRSLSNPWR
jgi:hypothetical protein